MIYYPIQTLVDAGIEDILIVTGGNHAGEFLRLLGNGEAFGLKSLNYAYQESEGGIAHALRLAENFANGDSVAVVLGDNIIQDSIKSAVDRHRQGIAAVTLFLKYVHDPKRFGVAELKDGMIISIEEKPDNPKSCYAVTGIYLYDNSVFDIAKTLKPSKRGELEITDVNNEYLKRKNLNYEILKGWWTDAGTFDSLVRANVLVWDKVRGYGEFEEKA